MYRSCSKCGKIHGYNEPCSIKRVFKKTKESELRNTYAWHSKAEEIKRRSKYLCALCLEEGKANYQGLEVHHIEKIKDNEERLLDDYNLICLCSEHHKDVEDNDSIKDRLFELARIREDGE